MCRCVYENIKHMLIKKYHTKTQTHTDSGDPIKCHTTTAERDRQTAETPLSATPPQQRETDSGDPIKCHTTTAERERQTAETPLSATPPQQRETDRQRRPH